MLLYPHCKLNLGLRITAKRPDGYHEIETIFYPVFRLCDVLEVNHSLGDDIRLVQSGISVDCASEDNLVVKCYRRMKAHYPKIGGVDVRLEKRIPFGAGLGGGSSDAAYMAYALNELFCLGLTREQLAEEVSHLGADCAFFLYGTPCYATGIGEILRPIDLSLKGMRLIMLKPDVYVSTKEAYAGITPHEEPHLLDGVEQSSISDNLSPLINDFEKTVFQKHPILGRIKAGLLDAGAVYASMSGSGSTIFGLFQNDAEGRADAYLRSLDKELAAMVIFNDAL